MLFTAASRGFTATDGFLVFPTVMVRVMVRVRVGRPLAMGPLAMTGMNQT